MMSRRCAKAERGAELNSEGSPNTAVAPDGCAATPAPRMPRPPPPGTVAAAPTDSTRITSLSILIWLPTARPAIEVSVTSTSVDAHPPASVVRTRAMCVSPSAEHRVATRARRAAVRPNVKTELRPHAAGQLRSERRPPVQHVDTAGELIRGDVVVAHDAQRDAQLLVRDARRHVGTLGDRQVRGDERERVAMERDALRAGRSSRAHHR